MMCKCEHPRAMHDSRGCPLFRCDCEAFDELDNYDLSVEASNSFFYQAKFYTRDALAIQHRDQLREANV